MTEPQLSVLVGNYYSYLTPLDPRQPGAHLLRLHVSSVIPVDQAGIQVLDYLRLEMEGPIFDLFFGQTELPGMDLRVLPRRNSSIWKVS